MTPRFRPAVLVASAALLISGGAALAADSCPVPCAKPPSNSRYVSTPGLPLPPFPGPILSATPALKLGKPKRVLVVEATVSTGGLVPFAPTGIAMQVTVNGVPLEPMAPTPFGASVDCGISGAVPPPFTCTVTGSFWIDLDQNPALLKVPLNVALQAGELPIGPPTGVPVVASMSMRLEKK